MQIIIKNTFKNLHNKYIILTGNFSVDNEVIN